MATKPPCGGYTWYLQTNCFEKRCTSKYGGHMRQVAQVCLLETLLSPVLVPLIREAIPSGYESGGNSLFAERPNLAFLRVRFSHWKSSLFSGMGLIPTFLTPLSSLVILEIHALLSPPIESITLRCTNVARARRSGWNNARLPESCVNVELRRVSQQNWGV